MKAFESVKIGEHRGSPRIWLDGMKAALAGFIPGKRFNIRKDEERRMLTLEHAPFGSRIVSRKMRGDKEIPVIDINSAEVLAIFEGMEQVRIIVQEMRIVIMPTTVELAMVERIARLRGKLERGETLLVGSVSHGGGVLSHALHAGLSAASVESSLAFANEIRPELLEHAREHNDSWNEQTVPLAAPMQELAFDAWAMAQLPRVEVLEGGLPCSGASRSGRAKNGAGHAEAHPEVGHLVVPFLAIIAKVQPALIVLENVTPYATSASMHIIRHQLRDFGYEVHETVLFASEWNSLESRERMCMVAATRGLDFDFAQLQRPERAERRIAEVLEQISLDDPRWSEMAGLKAKEIRDAEKGSNFKMQTITAFSTSCPTITKSYSKVRSTDPKLQHPTNPDLLRQLTPIEHARIKGVPEHLVHGLGVTLAHEILGQGVCYEPFKAVGRLLGHAIKQLSSSVHKAEPAQLQLVG